MSSYKEKLQWRFRCWRALIYSLSMAFLWAFPAIILGTILAVVGLAAYSASSVKDVEELPVFMCVIMLTAVGYLIATCLFLGAIPGLCAGIFVPSHESLNPFKSKFFMKVSGQAFLFLLLSLLLSHLISFLFDQFLDHTLNLLTSSYTDFPHWTSVFGVTYSYGIYRAVKNALRSQQSPKID